MLLHLLVHCTFHYNHSSDNSSSNISEEFLQLSPLQFLQALSVSYYSPIHSSCMCTEDYHKFLCNHTELTLGYLLVLEVNLLFLDTVVRLLLSIPISMDHSLVQAMIVSVCKKKLFTSDTKHL